MPEVSSHPIAQVKFSLSFLRLEKINSSKRLILGMPVLCKIDYYIRHKWIALYARFDWFLDLRISSAIHLLAASGEPHFIRKTFSIPPFQFHVIGFRRFHNFQFLQQQIPSQGRELAWTPPKVCSFVLISCSIFKISYDLQLFQQRVLSPGRELARTSPKVRSRVSLSSTFQFIVYPQNHVKVIPYTNWNVCIFACLLFSPFFAFKRR